MEVHLVKFTLCIWLKLLACSHVEVGFEFKMAAQLNLRLREVAFLLEDD